MGVSGFRTSPQTAQTSPSMGGCPLFPADNFWNVPINHLPVHPQSIAWVNSIGANTGFHMDFGSGEWAGGKIGIPYNLFSKSDSGVNEYVVDFYYPDESDPGPYPLNANPKIEHGGDHHILVVEQDDCDLYEIYDASWNGSAWSGGSGAIWDLSSNAQRPDTWTSADAAGLPILPGLARYTEVSNGVIAHALRFTANCTADYYIWPARHKAQHGSCANPVPFGARFRLKADYDTSGFSPQAQVLLQAFKTYGIVLADNGSDWYVSGSPSESWDNDQLHELDVLTGSDFEAVDTSGLMVDYDSAATTHSEIPHVYSMQRLDANPTGANTIRFLVHFSEPVTGVDSDGSDFSLSSSGVSGASILSVSGSGVSYTVLVDTGSGTGSIRLDIPNTASIQDLGSTPLSGLPYAGAEYTIIPTTSSTFKSAGVDGWVLEVAENGNTGGFINSADTTFRLGDDAADRQYRAILHFDTSSLPNTAIITSMTLKIKQQSVSGTNPFSSLGSLYVDLRTPMFGSSVGLELADFNFTAKKIKAGVFNANPVNSWYNARFNNGGNLNVNRTGATQLRLYFSVDDNNNNIADYIRFFSGNAAAGDRPKLLIQYFVP
jgi:hypothetical protein